MLNITSQKTRDLQQKKMAVQAEEKDTEGLYQELTKELKKSKPNITVVYQTQQLTFKSRRKEVQNLHDT